MASAAGIAGAATAGALGSIASQGLGVATGLQDRFSWTGVALAGLSSGIGAGLSGTFDGLSSSAVVRGALEGAAGNALTQGVGVVTGLQRRFDWTGVAVGAAVGGVTGGLGEALGVRPGIVSAGNVAKQAATGMAGAIAGAATRSLLDGTDFGDNVLATLPDVVGSTIGNLVADGIAEAAQTSPAQSGINNLDQIGIDLSDPRLSIGVPTNGDRLPLITQEMAQARREMRVAEIMEQSDAENRRNRSGPYAVVGPVTRETDDLRVEVRETLSLTINQGWWNDFRAKNAQHILKTGHPYANAAMLERSFSYWNDYLVGLNWQANRQIDREFGGILLGAAGGSAIGVGGGLAIAGAGLTGWGAFGAGLGVSGLSSGVSGLGLRWAFGGANSIATFGQDVLAGAVLDGALRGIVAGGSAAIGRLTAGRSAAETAGVDLSLTYKPGWSAAQRAEADLKVQILTEGDTVVSSASRSGTSAASRYRRAGNAIPVGNDVDHAIDLQLGGSDTVSNMWPLNSSVNRSLGSQIRQRIKNFPPGTVVNRVTIRDR